MAVFSDNRIGITAAELESALPSEKFVELVEGELIEMTPAGKWHNRVAYRIQRLFDDFCLARPELDFGGDNEGFLIRRNPDTLLSPDACLFRRRATDDRPWMEFAPEVVVEVLSPSNNTTEMAFKRQRYFDAGTEQFWLVTPGEKQLTIHHSDGRTEIIAAPAAMAGRGITEGLRIDLGEIFLED